MSALSSLHEPIEDTAGLPTATTTMLLTMVDLVCPHCADEQTGSLVDCDDGVAWVECHGCKRELDVDILAIPTQARLDKWRADALLHGHTAVECADGVHGCSYLALASCRRLAAELSPVGKIRLLDEIGGRADEPCTDAQRCVLLELGIALGLDAGAINAFLAVR